MISTIKNRVFKKIIVLVFWLALWQVLSMLISNGIFVPSPLSTLKSLSYLVKTSDFHIAVLTSLLRIVSGFVSGVLCGFIFGTISAKYSLFKEFTAPALGLIKAVPVASFIILAFLWFKSDILPVFISFLMVLPIIWTTTESSLSAVDIKYIQMGEVFGLSKLKIFLKIKLPLIFPAFLSATLNALGFAWKAGIAAEVITKPLNSLGGMLERSKSQLEISEVFAITVVVAVLSVLLEVLLKKLLRGYAYDKNQ